MTFFSRILTVIVLSLAFNLAHAGAQFIADGYAVSGYDTVAYFTQGKPVEGKESIVADWNGAKWLFSSEEHKQLFLANPEKYAPAYDGHCAYAAAYNDKVKAIPTAWEIVDDRLYLNFSKGVNNKWLKNIEQFIIDGDKNWVSLSQEPAAKAGWFN